MISIRWSPRSRSPLPISYRRSNSGLIIAAADECSLHSLASLLGIRREESDELRRRVKLALVNPLSMVAMIITYNKAVEGQLPNPEWEAERCFHHQLLAAQP